MNDDKWLSTPSVARLVAHLAETGDRERVAVVLADLAEVLDPKPHATGVGQRLRAWAAGTGPSPTLEEAWALDRIAEDDGDADALLAAELVAAVAHPSTQDGDPSHARRAADTMASMLAIELDVAPADASALLAERLRRRIPKRP